ncbi:MAG: hypothetical protein V4440_14775 [Pseudomonadota bacterium]
MSSESAVYQRGYIAGRKKTEADLNKEREISDRLNNFREMQKERIYMACLELALKHCNEWAVGGKKVDSADGFCKLAKVFADNSITKI